MQATGLWAWLINNPSAVRLGAVKKMVKEAHGRAWDQWMHAPNGADYGMPLRFSPRAFSTLGFTQRSAIYRMRQERMYGKAMPFVSPTRGSMHMRDMIGNRGSGWNQRSSGTSEIRTKLALPAASKLNRMGGKASVYRSEFYDVSSHPKDVSFLEDATVEQVTRGYLELIESIQDERATLKVG